MPSGRHQNSPINLRAFRENRDRFPAEQMVPYWGKQVAWSGDGTRIVASGATDEEVDEQLKALGIRCDQVVFGYIDDPNVSNLG